jgi:hypothetical protein
MRDHALELVDRAAEALAVLLGKFRDLRSRDATEKAKAEGDDANDP